MFNILKQHAIDNVWCCPEQNEEFIFKLNRLTPNDGSINHFQYSWEYISLPTTGLAYHVYHIGQINTEILSMLNTKNDFLDTSSWYSFKEVINSKNTLVNLYTEYGVELPRFSTYYMVTTNNDLVICVPQTLSGLFDFNKDYLYLRTYSNDFFENSSLDTVLKMHTDGIVVKANSDVVDFQVKVNKYLGVNGYVTQYVNGYKVDSVSLVNATIGDYIEYVYDSSVKTIIRFPLKGLPTFNSTMDNVTKYLLHYPGQTNVIDYEREVDVYVVQVSTGKGLYIHKNNENTLRNLTHKDYSLVVTYVTDDLKYFSDTNGLAVDSSDMCIEIHIKNNGYNRVLVGEKNRINELCKLPDSNIVQAMVGVNSTVSVWQAAKLESSTYVGLMGSLYKDISTDAVVDAYGYESLANIFANNIVTCYLDGVTLKAKVPTIYQNGCTAFEYDGKGLLIGYYGLSNGSTYICKGKCVYVEFIYGLATGDLDEYVGSVVSLKPTDEYRVYIQKSNKWLDVTNSDYYNIFNNTITFNNTLTNNGKTLVRTLNKFICYNKTVSTTSGILKLPIVYIQNINGTNIPSEMSIPMGELTVFMNGYSLSENLDYYYESNHIIIVNKSYLSGNNSEKIVIRFSGFCDNNLKHNTDYNSGFIINGNVSADKQYDIHNGNVRRIVIDGGLVLPNAVAYYEDGIGTSVFNSLNGKPYQISKPVIPLKTLTNVDTNTIYNSENTLDTQLSNYITKIVNPNQNGVLSVNQNKHYLFSPFLSNIISDLKTGIITDIPSRISGEYITGLCSGYEYLLLSDPAFISNSNSINYIIVQPHPLMSTVTLTVSQYNLIDNINATYFNNSVQLVNQIIIG